MSLIAAEYMCPEHGRFEVLVEREANGDAPDGTPCPVDDDCWDCGGQPSAPGRAESGCKTCNMLCHAPCGRASPWTISAPFGKVKAWEVRRGKWEKPERKTFLDTRKLGEGQDMEEFRADRRKIWDDQRKAEVMRMKRE